VLIGINLSLIYTHYSAALLLCAQAFHVIYLIVFTTEHNKRSVFVFHYALVVLGTVGLLLPLMPLFFAQAQQVASGGLWISTPTLADIYLLFPRLLFHTPRALGKTAIIAINGFLILAFLYPVAGKKRVDFLFFYVLIPPTLALLLSLVGIQMFVSKALFLIVPACLILSARFISALPRSLASVICVLYIISQSLLINKYYKTPQKEGWRAVSKILMTQSRPADTFYFTTPGTKLALDYYFPLAENQIQHSIDKPPISNRTIWIIHAMNSRSWKEIIDELSAKGYFVLFQKRTPGVNVAKIIDKE